MITLSTPILPDFRWSRWPLFGLKYARVALSEILPGNYRLAKALPLYRCGPRRVVEGIFLITGHRFEQCSQFA